MTVGMNKEMKDDVKALQKQYPKGKVSQSVWDRKDAAMAAGGILHDCAQLVQYLPGIKAVKSPTEVRLLVEELGLELITAKKTLESKLLEK